MNSTQTQTSTATIVAFIAGVLAGRGVFGFDTATWITILTAVLGGGMTIWTAIATRKKAIITAVNNMDEVAGVITKNTPEGQAMAVSIPEPTVTPEGTNTAIAVAKGQA